VLPAMLSVHAKIGIAEALITIMAIEILKSIAFNLDGMIDEE
jgi:hypothetical protein